MGKLENIQELFHNQLRDIYSTERQLLENLPIIVNGAPSQTLKKAIANHLEETRKHKKRLDDIGNLIGIELSGEISRAMEALIREAKSIIAEDSDPVVKNTGILATAQRMENYKISAYGTTLQFALALNYQRTIRLLQQTLSEEKDAGNKLAEIFINQDT